MKILKKMSKHNNKLLLGCFLGAIVIIGVILFLFFYPKKTITPQDITIELGNKISNKVKDYMGEVYNDYSKFYLDCSNVPQENNITKKVGIYQYTIKYKKDKYKGKIKVVDTTAPELILKNVSIVVGDKITKDSFLESCTDLTSCTIEYEDNAYVNSITNTVGSYQINIVATDENNNKTIKQASLEIKIKPVYKPIVYDASDGSGSGRGIPVLNYHFTVNNEEYKLCSPSSICMKEELFDEHMAYIKNNGFYTATLKELEQYIDGEINLPDKSVVITIDDGWFVSRAIIALEKYNLKGTLFLIGSLASPAAYNSPNLEVHSHGWDLHNPGVCSSGRGGGVLCMERASLLEDLRKSRESLNNTTYFCYPFYEYNDYAIDTLKDAGFTMALTGGNTRAKVGCNKFKVPRYIIYGNTSVQGLANIIN